MILVLVDRGAVLDQCRWVWHYNADLALWCDSGSVSVERCGTTVRIWLVGSVLVQCLSNCVALLCGSGLCGRAVVALRCRSNSIVQLAVRSGGVVEWWWCRGANLVEWYGAGSNGRATVQDLVERCGATMQTGRAVRHGGGIGSTGQWPAVDERRVAVG